MAEVDRGGRLWRAASAGSLALALSHMAVMGHSMGGDTVEYVAGADALLGDGSYEVVRYPPGYPMLLAPFRWLDLPLELVASAGGVAVIVLVWLLAVRLAGHPAGLAAGLICATTPVIVLAGRQVMADSAAAALVLGAVWAAHAGRWRLAGLLVAGSGWMRLGHAVFLVASPRRRMLVAGVVALVPLVLFNLAVYGTVDGYDSDQASWGLGYFFQGEALHGIENPTPYGGGFLYPALLLGKSGGLVPLAAVAAVAEMWHRRWEAATRFAAGVVAANVVLYAFYYYQSYRFILPAAAVLAVYAGAFVGRLSGQERAVDARTPCLEGDLVSSRPQVAEVDGLR